MNRLTRSILHPQMRSAVQFLDLDLDLNELGGDISWSPARHTLVQDLVRGPWIPGFDKYFLVMEKAGDYHQTFQVPKMEVLTYISCM